MDNLSIFPDPSEMKVILWGASNILAGLAFLHLPFEIWGWTRRLDVVGLATIAGLFATFIGLCGVHHVYMVIAFYGMHPVDAPMVAIDTTLAVGSCATSAVLARYRKSIRLIFTSFAETVPRLRDSEAD